MLWSDIPGECQSQSQKGNRIELYTGEAFPPACMGGFFICVLLATWHTPASTPPGEGTDSHIESPV